MLILKLEISLGKFRIKIEELRTWCWFGSFGCRIDAKF